ncbi:MAG: DUF1450 domain-containing protein [Tumebacillaceae bacterium]
MGQSKRLVIDFCNDNLGSFTQELLLQLREKYPHWSISKYGCLTNCGECEVRPFAIVDDEIIAAATVEELREKILAIAESKDAL